MMAQPNATEIQRFFELLYPDVEDGWLVLSHPDTTHLAPQGKHALRSHWFNLATTPWQKIVSAAHRLAKRHSVYFGVCVQHPTREPLPYRRGWNSTAYIVPGLWFDLDLAYGQHAASTLPQTDAEALDFLGSLPAAPSSLSERTGYGALQRCETST